MNNISVGDLCKLNNISADNAPIKEGDFFVVFGTMCGQLTATEATMRDMFVYYGITKEIIERTKDTIRVLLNGQIMFINCNLNDLEKIS